MLMQINKKPPHANSFSWVGKNQLHDTVGLGWWWFNIILTVDQQSPWYMIHVCIYLYIFCNLYYHFPTITTPGYRRGHISQIRCRATSSRARDIQYCSRQNLSGGIASISWLGGQKVWFPVVCHFVVWSNIMGRIEEIQIIWFVST